jgi:hypothetical protein
MITCIYIESILSCNVCSLLQLVSFNTTLTKMVLSDLDPPCFRLVSLGTVSDFDFDITLQSMDRICSHSVPASRDTPAPARELPHCCHLSSASVPPPTAETASTVCMAIARVIDLHNHIMGLDRPEKTNTAASLR